MKGSRSRQILDGKASSVVLPSTRGRFCDPLTSVPPISFSFFYTLGLGLVDLGLESDQEYLVVYRNLLYALIGHNYSILFCYGNWVLCDYSSSIRYRMSAHGFASLAHPLLNFEPAVLHIWELNSINKTLGNSSL